MGEESFEELKRQFKEIQDCERRMLERALEIEVYETVTCTVPTEEQLYRRVVRK